MDTVDRERMLAAFERCIQSMRPSNRPVRGGARWLELLQCFEYGWRALPGETGGAINWSDIPPTSGDTVRLRNQARNRRARCQPTGQ